MSETEFIKSLEDIDIHLTEKQVEQFKIYLDFLIEYNQHCNLTAIKTEEEVYLKHYFDSLMILKYRNFDNVKVLDIGSGAGFPGVPLKIVKPSVSLTCLDSNGKKTQFLLLLRSKLGIDFEVINERAEEYITGKRESFDYVLSRAVSNLPVLCELCIPFVKIGGEMIAYKGADMGDSGEYAATTLGAQIKDVYCDELPFENSKRTFVCIQKKCKTNEIYPRRYDKIIKKTLQNLQK